MGRNRRNLNNISTITDKQECEVFLFLYMHGCIRTSYFIFITPSM